MLSQLLPKLIMIPCSSYEYSHPAILCPSLQLCLCRSICVSEPQILDLRTICIVIVLAKVLVILLLLLILRGILINLCDTHKPIGNVTVKMTETHC